MEEFYFLRGLKTAVFGIVLLIVFFIWFGLSTIGGDGNTIAAFLFVGALATTILGPIWYWIGSPLWAAIAGGENTTATETTDDSAVK